MVVAAGGVYKLAGEFLRRLSLFVDRLAGLREALGIFAGALQQLHAHADHVQALPKIVAELAQLLVRERVSCSGMGAPLEKRI